MEQAVIALGANIGDRKSSFRKSAEFLRSLSLHPAAFSPIYESEPVGLADREFFNAVAVITTELPPPELLTVLKDFEKSLGRDTEKPRWSNRLIDLDIITYGNVIFDENSLLIPHPEYRNRLFVLLPLQDVLPGFTDPRDNTGISELILAAPKISVYKSGVKW
jgi:2-amino-4-hydroxy-6-hydroxymethyldihydropteridine diphosphokinase